ncbi:SRPBCC family protein [Mucilaginibacter psychrotolerans]|uniref:SRPBCC domain-containing protein n=1 Tax=Mucilaginibacter psychrotolerans TaxID=1524096 RepID=A0A4Y8S9S5_9SPHI|nr:SRPBCC domain-containing protein [Mucilaginibacter psychrotolerans]TFF35642.1 SRPBCC domain-containing protein [Mucilaginibacter psychrotolerans]
MTDFTTSFTVTQTPQQVFDAVTNVRGWWSESLEGASKQQSDEFVYRHKDVHYSKHLLTEVVPLKKVVWLTTDGSINFVNDKTEWNGTTVVFDIEEKGGQTTLWFTHIGLVPALDCYEGCSGGWNYYLQSLRNLITTGKGNPDL